jgi:hypothetical protein
MALSNQELFDKLFIKLDELEHAHHTHLLEASKINSKIDNLCADLDDYQVKVDVLYESFQKMQGVTHFIQVLFLVVAPLAAVGHWLRDHIKW